MKYQRQVVILIIAFSKTNPLGSGRIETLSLGKGCGQLAGSGNIFKIDTVFYFEIFWVCIEPEPAQTVRIATFSCGLRF
jgi:hypothetical protein